MKSPEGWERKAADPGKGRSGAKKGYRKLRSHHENEYVLYEDTNVSEMEWRRS